MNLFCKFGHHLLPALTLGCRYPGIMKPSRIYSHERQELLEHLETAACVEVSDGIVAILRVAAGDEYAVHAVYERFCDKQGVHASSAGNAHDSQVRRLFEAAHAGRIGASV